jgi:hypothetical protein
LAVQPHQSPAAVNFLPYLPQRPVFAPNGRLCSCWPFLPRPGRERNIRTSSSPSDRIPDRFPSSSLDNASVLRLCVAMASLKICKIKHY